MVRRGSEIGQRWGRQHAGGEPVDQERRELILTYLNKGDFIGEMGVFIESANRSAMIRTRSARP
ncbi:MAG: hypothetical protein H7842_00455 [Gammaproteobacteria bacterium SHHR-1]|uniref:hypothetical protein n=1 Tax=Magnetovirga frankeli TaxID=947516 RepID=UPI001293CF2B|nr:hypothetical protein D5125_16700 [gamma proteobacterium SS-5]